MQRQMRLIVIFLFLTISCNAQVSNKVDMTADECNRQVYGTKKYIQYLPKYICIPNGFIIDDFVRISDLNKNNKSNFLSIKYNRKQDDQIDGELTYWDFYSKSDKDTIFHFDYTLKNLVPPFLKNTDLSYVTTHPTAQKIYSDYPFRMDSQELSFVVNTDTLKLSYKFDDSYGKRFVFIYDHTKNDWFLKNVEYFIGELPKYWWTGNSFYYPLIDDIKVIEQKLPKSNISIQKFNLKEAFRYKIIEWIHLAESHIDNLVKSNYKSISDVTFLKCDKMNLPADWIY